MEALSFGDEQCMKLNHSVVEENTYDFINVEFMSTDNVYFNHLWSIRSDYYVKISSNTKVINTTKTITIPLCPRSFLEFENLVLMKHHALIGMLQYFYHTIDRYATKELILDSLIEF